MEKGEQISSRMMISMTESIRRRKNFRNYWKLFIQILWHSSGFIFSLSLITHQPSSDYLVYEDLLDSMVRFSGKKKERKKNESFPAKRE